MGPEVDAICLAALTRRPIGEVLVALDEAVAAGIVTASTGGRFSHDLVGEAARLELPTVERLHLHQRIAAYLAGRSDAGSRVAEPLREAPGFSGSCGQALHHDGARGT